MLARSQWAIISLKNNGYAPAEVELIKEIRTEREQA